MPNRHAALATLAILIASSGCHDSTAPAGIVVSVAADGPPTTEITDTPNGPKITCTIGLTATARGKGSATWGDAKTIWYIGRDRTTPVDTTYNFAPEVQGAFGDQISGGDTRHTSWYFFDAIPFEVTLELAYTTDDNKTAIAKTHVVCGPPPTGATIPTITQVSVPSTTGEIKSGVTISVSYQETSGSGIWMSIVDVTGAFITHQILGEHLATNVSRTVNFIVPQTGLNPGVPLTVSLRAFNVALEGTARSLETQLHFVDRVPPRLIAGGFIGSVGLPPFGGLNGQYAVGDVLPLSVTAQDDNLLAWLVWSLDTPSSARDSVPAGAGQAYQYWVTNITVRPEWVGTPVLTLYARDAAGLTSSPASSASGALRFYPVVNHPTTAPLQLSTLFDADDRVYDQKRGLMYVAVPRDHRIVAFAPATMTLATPIALPGEPAAMDISLGGDSLLVAVPSANAIEVIDLDHPEAAPTSIHLSVVDSTTPAYAGAAIQPGGLRIASNGKMLVMLTNATSSNDEVVEVDLKTGAQRFRTDARGLSTSYPFWTRYLGRTNDHSRIYIMGFCAARYDAATDAFTLCAQGVGISNFDGMTVDATGTYLTRGTFVIDADMHPVFTPNAINGQLPYVAISPDDATLYLGAHESITTMRRSDGVMLERIPMPLTAERLFVDPNGKWVLAFQNTYGARVTRVDLQ